MSGQPVLSCAENQDRLNYRKKYVSSESATHISCGKSAKRRYQCCYRRPRGSGPFDDQIKCVVRANETQSLAGRSTFSRISRDQKVNKIPNHFSWCVDANGRNCMESYVILLVGDETE